MMKIQFTKNNIPQNGKGGVNQSIQPFPAIITNGNFAQIQFNLMR